MAQYILPQKHGMHLFPEYVELGILYIYAFWQYVTCQQMQNLMFTFQYAQNSEITEPFNVNCRFLCCTISIIILDTFS